MFDFVRERIDEAKTLIEQANLIERVARLENKMKNEVEPGMERNYQKALEGIQAAQQAYEQALSALDQAQQALQAAQDAYSNSQFSLQKAEQAFEDAQASVERSINAYNGAVDAFNLTVTTNRNSFRKIRDNFNTLRGAVQGTYSAVNAMVSHAQSRAQEVQDKIETFSLRTSWFADKVATIGSWPIYNLAGFPVIDRPYDFLVHLKGTLHEAKRIFDTGAVAYDKIRLFFHDLKNDFNTIRGKLNQVFSAVSDLFNSFAQYYSEMMNIQLKEHISG